MIFNIPVGGKAKTTVSVYGAASEDVTLTSEKGEVFTTTTDAAGYGGELELPVGVYTIAGSYTEYSKSLTVKKDTTEVYAMPDGTIVYWYGYKPYAPAAKKYAPNVENRTSNTKAPTITTNTRSIMVRQPSVSGNYIGSAIFDNVKTDGGVLTFKSGGKSANNSSPKVYFSYAKSITADGFTPISSNYVDYGEKETTLGTAAAGTYDIAISAQNGGANYHGQVTVYAVYFAE